MAINPVFESIKLNKKQAELKDQVKVDSTLSILSEDVKKILSATAFSVITDKSVVGDKIKYGGRVNFFISYVNQEGKIEKIESATEFISEISCADILEEDDIRITTKTEKVLVDLSAGKAIASAYIGVFITVFSSASVSVLSGGDELIVDSKEVPFVKSLGKKEAVMPVEEQFELGVEIEQVLYHRVSATITSVGCGVGSIIVDGQTLFSVIALQKNSKGNIIREDRAIPFRMEIECEEAMPALSANALVVEKAFKTDVKVEEDGGKSTITLNATLLFIGEAFAESSAVIVCDAFSLDEHVELKPSCFPYYKVCDMRSNREEIFTRHAVEELPVGTILCAVGEERAEVLTSEIVAGKIKVTGTICARLYFADNQEGYFSALTEAPFEVYLEAPVSEDANLSIIAKAEKARARIVSATEVEVSLEVYFNVYPCVNGIINYVSEVNSLGKKEPDTHAISVYIPTPGEDLWGLSKRLNVDPQTLVETNKELRFPLTGDERIVIYRKK